MPDAPLLETLFEAARRVHERGKSPIVVLDLDGTLYDTTVRSLRIVQEFAHQHSTEHPSFQQAVARLSLSDTTYRVSDTLARVGVSDERLLKQVHDFWMTRFFTDDYVLYDLPTPGAVAFVRRLHAGGVMPCYLTGRDAPNMLVGTVEALRRDGFPVGTVSTRLILKDDFDTPDEAFKQAVVEDLRSSGEVIGAFDNEPGLCNLFARAFPEAIVVHLDTTHSPEAPPLEPGVPAVSSFLPLLTRERC